MKKYLVTVVDDEGLQCDDPFIIEAESIEQADEIVAEIKSEFFDDTDVQEYTNTKIIVTYRFSDKSETTQTVTITEIN